MEEDIKVLEEYLNYEATKRKLSGCEIQAIEHLIARNKELEEMLKHRIKYTNELEQDLYENASNYVIPKSKLREKIEELKFKTANVVADEINQIIIKVLEELLEERS